MPAQLVDAAHALNLSAGVSNPKVSGGTEKLRKPDVPVQTLISFEGPLVGAQTQRTINSLVPDAANSDTRLNRKIGRNQNTGVEPFGPQDHEKPAIASVFDRYGRVAERVLLATNDGRSVNRPVKTSTISPRPSTSRPMRAPLEDVMTTICRVARLRGARSVFGSKSLPRSSTGKVEP